MKIMLFIVSILLSVSTHAQVMGGGGQRPGPIPTAPASRGSTVVITPVWPTTCLESELKWHLNTVYDVVKMDETDSTVTFQFKTQYVQCNRGALVPYQLEGYGAMAEVVSRRVIIVHLNGTPMESQAELSRPDEMQITVKFFKRRIFRSANQKNKIFQMVFVPRPSMDPRRGNMMFWWNVNLIREGASYELKVTQGER